MTKISKHIVITGASSGIGEALALDYANAGVMLSITGRNQERLDEVSKACSDKGASVNAKIIDVADKDAMEKWLYEIDEIAPVDLIIANAGISAGTEGSSKLESREQVDAVFGVNLYGALNTIHPLMDKMAERRSGQIAIMASLAGYRGWPGAPTYCASKAAVKTYGESLRTNLAKHGVKINVICPGFVKSRMTDVNNFPMPFLMETDKAVSIIRKGLERNKSRISFPWQTTFFAWLFSIMPDALAHKFLSGTPSKGA